MPDVNLYSTDAIDLNIRTSEVLGKYKVSGPVRALLKANLRKLLSILVREL